MGASRRSTGFSPDSLLTQKDLAHVLGVGTRWVRQLRDEGVIPIDDRTQRYPLAASVQAYCAFLEARGPAREERIDAEQQRARKVEAEADLAEMRRDEMAGRLVEASLAQRAIEDAFAAVRSELLRLEKKIPPSLRKLVGGAIRATLRHLAHPTLVRSEEDDAA